MIMDHGWYAFPDDLASVIWTGGGMAGDAANDYVSSDLSNCVKEIIVVNARDLFLYERLDNPTKLLRSTLR